MGGEGAGAACPAPTRKPEEGSAESPSLAFQSCSRQAPTHSHVKHAETGTRTPFGASNFVVINGVRWLCTHAQCILANVPIIL